MSDTDETTCTCPLIETSDYTNISYVRGDPRGTGCPLHETQELRDERQYAMDYARYHDTRDMPMPKWMQARERHAAMRPAPDTTWIEMLATRERARRRALLWWKRIMGGPK